MQGASDRSFEAAMTVQEAKKFLVQFRLGIE